MVIMKAMLDYCLQQWQNKLSKIQLLRPNPADNAALNQFMEATWGAYESEWKADFAPRRQAWEQWYVEDWEGKVVFKAIHSPGRFLTANPDKGEGLVDKWQEWEQWVPFKNADNTWSFLSHHGTWLSSFPDGNISLVYECDMWEHFNLERW